MAHDEKLSESIQRAFTQKTEGLTVGDVLESVSTKGFGLLLTVLALPILAPFTPPGIPIPFAVLILLLSFQLLFNRESPWVPEWITKRPIKSGGQSKFLNFMVRTMQFFEKMLRPRLGFFLTGIPFKALVLPCLVLAGITMMTPLPVVNSAAALAVVLIGLGMVEEDGLFLIGGVVSSLLVTGLVVAFIVAIILYGPEGVNMVLKAIGLKRG